MSAKYNCSIRCHALHCIACFTEDDVWYEARVLRVLSPSATGKDKHVYQVTCSSLNFVMNVSHALCLTSPHTFVYTLQVMYIDYGNEEVVGENRVRPSSARV
jgi:hypothetical protein